MNHENWKPRIISTVLALCFGITILAPVIPTEAAPPPGPHGRHGPRMERPMRRPPPEHPHHHDGGRVLAAGLLGGVLGYVLASGGGHSSSSDSVYAVTAQPAYFQGHRYRLYSGVAATWEDAEAYCESVGGHLAVINSAEENYFLRNYIETQYRATGNSRYKKAFFELTDIRDDGYWETINGEPMYFENWANGQPSRNASNNYAYLSYSNGLWKAGSFNGNAFLCEWDSE